MRLQKRAAEQGGPKVPGYIVTYSDMTTLLLTFFVMLLSLSQVQDPELFNKGRDSFIKSIKYVGLGMFFGRKKVPYLGQVKPRYYIINPDKLSENRIIDEREEEKRRIMAKLSQHMTITEPKIVTKNSNFSITNISFRTGEATLDEKSKKFLREFCLHLQQSFSSKPFKIYVLGLACDEATEKQQWILSAKRAQVAADYIQDNLPPAFNVSVFSWGAGPGGNWVGKDSLVSKQSHILIAVMR